MEATEVVSAAVVDITLTLTTYNTCNSSDLMKTSNGGAGVDEQMCSLWSLNVKGAC